MKTFDLYRIYEVMNTLSEKQEELSENSIYVNFLGTCSSYTTMSFESFLEYYSFKIDGNNIIVFNDDSVPYESYSNDDFSYIPIILLSFSTEKLDKWMQIEISLELARQGREKIAEKENIKKQIELLSKRLEKL